VLLDRGAVAAVGPVGEVVGRYLAGDAPAREAARFAPGARGGTGWARITDAHVLDDGDRPVGGRPCDGDLCFELEARVMGDAGGSLRGLVLEVVVCTERGEPLLSLMNVDDAGVELPAGRACRVRVRIPAPTFRPGRYRLDLFLGLPYLQHVDEVVDAIQFDVLPPERPWRPYPVEEGRGVFFRRADWAVLAPGPARETADP